MLYHYFYCTFSCYLPRTKPDLKNLYNCSYIYLRCAVIEVSYSKGSNMSPPPLPEDGNRSSLQNVVFLCRILGSHSGGYKDYHLLSLCF
jgi:hypothetical protein